MILKRRSSSVCFEISNPKSRLIRRGSPEAANYFFSLRFLHWGGGVTLNFYAVPVASAQAQERHLYLAHWEWFCESADNCYWRAPGGDALGALDLRAIPGMSKPGGTPEGYGLFTYDRQVSIPGSMYLGDSLDVALSPPQKAQIRTALNIRGFIQSDTVKDILWDILTVHSDPKGQTGPKPLLGKQGETVKLYLGGFSLIKEELFDEEHRQRTIAVFQEDYKRNKADGVSLETLQRWTGQTMKDLYGKMDDETAEKILPQEHKADKWKEPHTTIIDNFNRADADALGTSSEGWSWTEVLNDIDIVSNKASQQSIAAAGNDARAEFDLSSADHYAQAMGTIVNTTTSQIDTTVRYAAAANTFYTYRVELTGGTPNHDLSKKVVGTFTSLATDDVTDGLVAGVAQLIYTEINGSILTGKLAGVQIIQVTDTAITGNLRTGISGLAGGTGRVLWDDFQAGDLAVAAAGRRFTPNISSFEVANLTATSATVKWYTSASVETMLTGIPAPVVSSQDAERKTWHEVSFTNLSPDTIYFYTIHARTPGTSDESTASFSFKTLPASPLPSSFPEPAQSASENPEIEELLRQIQELQMIVIDLAKRLVEVLRWQIQQQSL